MFVLDGYAFDAYPTNRRSTDLPLFPVHYYRPNKHVPAQTSVVGVSVRVETMGATLNVKDIYYSRGTSLPASAARVQGPFPSDSLAAPPPWRPLPVARFPLTAGACTYMWLEFDVPAPAPSDPFTITIGGIKSVAGAVSLPPIFFEPAHTYDTFAAP